MSTSITANIGPRASGADPQQLPQPPHQQDATTPTPATGIDAIPFASPVIRVDPDTGLALLVVRDSKTGDQLNQYPSKKAVEEYQRHQVAQTAPHPTDHGETLTTAAVAPPAPVSAAPASPDAVSPGVTLSAGTTVKSVAG